MERQELLGRLREYQSTECHNVFRLLLKLEISEMRAKNDTAEVDQVLKNQGGLAILKRLFSTLSPKSRDKIPVYDGAFGD